MLGILISQTPQTNAIGKRRAIIDGKKKTRSSMDLIIYNMLPITNDSIIVSIIRIFFNLIFFGAVANPPRKNVML